jgi:ligand-binding sensor domain-containing protein
MTHHRRIMKSLGALLVSLFMASCVGPQALESISQQQLTDEQPLPPAPGEEQAAQIGNYVVEMFEDSRGHLWFGTMAHGVARYDGQTLRYFTKEDGLGGNAVAAIAEDREGHMWFGTHSGLSKYDGEGFKNFTVRDGLSHYRVSSILFDRAGRLWVGTWGGVCRYDPSTDLGAAGKSFIEFPIPTPDVQLFSYQSTMNWVTEIMEDERGNIWFGRDGYGACKYDGQSFTHFTTRDGLPSNNVQEILEDRHGNIWFASRVAQKDSPDPDARTGDGGLCQYDGKIIAQYPKVKGLARNEIYTIYEDKTGNIWIGASGVGVYRFDGEHFRLYPQTDRPDLTDRLGLQSALEDRNGRLWFGFSGGLFRLAGNAIVNVTRDGPWD